jgi:hypothetical protein
MKFRKQTISLFEFLKDGNFGSFIPRRDCSPEDVIAVLGEPDGIEVCATGKIGTPYTKGDATNFPVIVGYGDIEFHFDSPATMLLVFSDTFFSGIPTGGPLRLTDAALLSYRRAIEDFMSLAKSRGLVIKSVEADASHEVCKVRTSGNIELHFEHDVPDNMNSKASLRAFYWSHNLKS